MRITKKNIKNKHKIFNNKIYIQTFLKFFMEKEKMASILVITSILIVLIGIQIFVSSNSFINSNGDFLTIMTGKAVSNIDKSDSNTGLYLLGALALSVMILIYVLYFLFRHKLIKINKLKN